MDTHKPRRVRYLRGFLLFGGTHFKVLLYNLVLAINGQNRSRNENANGTAA